MKKEGKNKNWNFPKRLFYFFFFCILILYAQYAYLALSPNVYGINMDAFAKSRNTVKTTLTATRGSIFDSTGNLMALNVTSYTVIAYLDASRTKDMKNPKHVVDKEATATSLAPVLEMEASYILNLLSTKNVYQVELGPGGRGITELKKEEVENLGLAGIDFIETHKRYYPNGDFASYIVGYAKQQEDGNIAGELGIELLYDEQLRGEDGYLEYQRDKYGYKIPDTKEIRIDAQDGYDIYLTIDSSIQRFVEGTLKELTAEYTPEWMMMTVMDAKTGKILATSSTPSFDPNIRNITNYENPLTSYVFEPGSTMKTYTYMCAMEKGTYNGSATYVSGTYTIGENVIQDWNNGKGWGVVTYDKGYEYSSNVGAVNIVNTFISKNELRECLSKYGFGETTGIELPRELTGSIKFTYPVEVAAASYGQGITTTAIQQLQGLTLISNNGKMLKPHIIDKIINPNTDEIVYESLIQESEQLVSQKTAQAMKELMYNTVHNRDSGGTTGTLFDIDGFEIIGKTGTAQIYDSQNGGYLKGKNDYIYSFAGMYPKDNPEIIMYVAAKRPSVGQSMVVAKATTSVMKSIAKYKNMFHEKTETTSTIQYEMKNYQNQNSTETATSLQGLGVQVVMIGDGNKVIGQYPSKGATLLSKDKVFLLTNSSNWVMPDMTGWSRIDVIHYLTLLGIEYQFDGYGYVIGQSLGANEKLDRGMKLTFTLQEKYQFQQPITEENQEETE